jgi:predicted O-methyltransferase YrrM
MIHRIKSSISKRLKEHSKRNDIKSLLRSGLPYQMKSILEFLMLGEMDNHTKSVMEVAEQRRADIAKGGDKKIPIWYSPKPNSASDEATSPNARPEPGKVLEFTLTRVAATGKDYKWGTVLHLLARDFKSTIGFELGTCAGISALYISAAPTIEKLITVEGSEALAEISRESLKQRKQVKVVNELFDDALEAELPILTKKVDLAYIDGHHEKVATIHYFNKLLPYLSPGALILFDDVSWSYDMRDAWNIISKRTEFSHAIDLGAIGVCIMKSGESSDKLPTYWDLQPYTGKFLIGDPPGWKE